MSSARLLVRALEDRIAPATFTVTNTGDVGTGGGNSGDLRYCITQANVDGGSNVINYAAGVGGTSVASNLPAIANNLTINAASLSLNGWTLSVGGGATVILSGGQVLVGYLNGAGTVATDPSRGTLFEAVTSEPSLTIVSNSGADSFIHFNDDGPFYVAANINASTPVTFNGLTSGEVASNGPATVADIAVGANTRVNASNLQTYGTLTLAAGTSGTTQLTNVGTSALGFGGGSQTFISAAADAANQNAGIDLHGQNAVVSGLFVNNGFVIDSSNGNAGPGKVVGEYGSLIQGAGFFQNSVLTPNLGQFEPGNGPGSSTFGSFHFSGPTGDTGVSNFNWEMNDAGPSGTYPNATGVAGPTPNAAEQVSGWGLVKVAAALSSPGNFYFDATPTDKLTVYLQTLAAPNDVNGSPNYGGTYSTISVGADASGPPAEFDPTQPYTWPVVTYQGTYTGPTNSATLNASTNFENSQFVGVQPGTFGWNLAPNAGGGGQLDLVYTPPPPAPHPPSAPNAPTAVATGPNSINLSWNSVAGALNYELDYSVYPTGPWTQVYYASGTSFTDDNSVFGHLFANTTYYYRVDASNAAGDSPFSTTTAVTTPHNPTLTMASVVVNDGSAQRSEVQSITVTFSDAPRITFTGGTANAAAAFELNSVQTGNDVTLSAAVGLNPQGRTTVTLTFSGSQTDPVSAENGGSPSLADGRYTLTIFSSNVSSADGQLDGTGAGVPGVNYVSPTDTLGGGPGELGLYRLFGDTNGDGIDDQLDLGQFRAAFNASAGSAAYLPYLDADNSGTIDQVDLGQFRARFSSQVFPPMGPVVATPPPTVAAVQINDGSAQRSEVRSITVTFSAASGITFTGGNANAAAAFELTDAKTHADVALSAAVAVNGQNQTVVTLTFSGSQTDPMSAENGGSPSLADGRYTLTIFSSNVSSAGGQLDGTGAGVPGVNYVSPTDTLGGGPGQLGLYRLFGDTNGDGVDDQLDLGQFRGALIASAGDPAYLSYLDADNNGTVDQLDLGQFRARLNSSVF